MQTALPEDPLDNVSGGRFLRLTNDCPKEGVFVILSKPTVVHNEKFAKDEYQWPVMHFTPHPVEKTMTESSPGFCDALKKTTKGEPYGKVLRIHWMKTAMSGGRQIREWSIKLADESDIKAAFAQG